MYKVSNLTKNVVKNYPQFNIRADLDYVEDGKRTYGYDYKGKLRITTFRTDNLTYMDIDLYDYYRNHTFDFLWDDIPDDIKDACFHKYNGVSEIDMDELVAVCEDVIKRLDDLDEQVNNETLDMSGVLDRVRYERNFVAEIIESMKKVDWWDIPSDKIHSVHKSLNAVMKADMELDKIATELSGRGWTFLSVKEQRQLLSDLKEYGFIKFSLNTKHYSMLKENVKELMGIVASM